MKPPFLQIGLVEFDSLSRYQINSNFGITMRLNEIDKSYLKFLNGAIGSSGPYTIMINDGQSGRTWDSDDNRATDPFETFDEAKSFAEKYVELNPESWVVVLDKHESQVLAHVPWSKKPNKWNSSV